MRKKVGLLTLGITLILCGTAIILTRYTDIRLFKDIFLLWPAFLILLGLEFIFTKLWYDFKKQDVQLSPSGISIFLAILILFISSAWTNPGFRIPGFNWNFDLGRAGFFYSDSVEDTVEVESAETADVRQIVVNNERGAVEVQPSDDGQLRLEAKIRIDTNKKDEAYALIRDIITVDRRDGIMTVSVKNPSTSRDHSLQYVNMTLWVPRDTELELSTGFDRVSVKDMENNVTVRQQHGDVNLENIRGNATINSSFTAIRAAGITGDLNLINSHGEVQVENVSGSASIENSFDSTKAQQIGKDLTVKSKHGEVQAKEIKGNASIENEYDDISCSNLGGSLKVLGQHGAVSLEDIKGNIDAETTYDDIRLANPSYDNADIKANTSFSSIRGDDEIHLKVNDEENLQEASVINGSGSQKIRLKNQNGDITIERNQ